MKYRNPVLFFLLAALLAGFLSGCGSSGSAAPAVTATPLPTATPQPTPTPTAAPTATPACSELFLPRYTVEQVLEYFNEVCLDSEWVNSGNPSYIQKWAEPIRYHLQGDPTAGDMAVLDGLCEGLNRIHGFPGIGPADTPESANLDLFFCTGPELLQRMDGGFVDAYTEGAVTFWYDGEDRIYNATICIRSDLDQTLRNSVILEEFYNGLGPIQDTELRTDSIIYQHASTATELTEMDWLLLKLLYHPDMLCGMDAAQAETVIRSLYWG